MFLSPEGLVSFRHPFRHKVLIIPSPLWGILVKISQDFLDFKKIPPLTPQEIANITAPPIIPEILLFFLPT